MIPGILGRKLSQSQTFSEDGKRIPITVIMAGPCTVVGVKTEKIDKYQALQLGFANKKSNLISKPVKGHLKKAGLENNLPRFLREIRLEKGVQIADTIKPGATIMLADVLKPGDRVAVSGVSKGKGFAGVVKLHHFRGGPRTHGQSDRERAPGAIGQTTTPGRVYKGKRMARRMGNDKVTVNNLPVIALDTEKNLLTLKGLVPGAVGSLLTIRKL
ncbi:50S ribosomal protein L3 [Candidatus Gottesmanbacteria bacterium]|nr:50S ribosomal protein L3 [Candidatus Gottesmanbacteria bacterium]